MKIEQDTALLREFLDTQKIDINLNDLRGEARFKELNFKRSLVVYFLRKKGHTLQSVASFLNRKNHATVINLENYLNKKQARDPRYTSIIPAINDKFFNKKVAPLGIMQELENRMTFHKAEYDKYKAARNILLK
jgi:hypothetical protein